MAQQPLTVLQLLPALEAGGVEQGTLEVAAELIRQGHRSIVISAGGRLVETLRRGGSEHYTWPVGVKSPLTLSLASRLRRFLSQQRPVDILHARSRMPAWVAWLACRNMPEPIRPRFITTVHGLYSVNRYSRIMTWGEKVIAVSESVRHYVLENYPEVRPERLEVILRGVDPEIYSYGHQPDKEWLTCWEATYPQLRGRKILTLPGRLTRLKGHHDFIELLGRLRDGGYPVHGLIVGGEGPRRRYADEIRQQISHKGLQRTVTLTGHRRDLREIYAISDLVLSLSGKPESFGRTVLEALSLGVPVIGYDHGGVGEVLGDLFPEGRVPVNNLSSLSERIIQFVKEPPVVPKQQRYTLQRMLEQTLQCYRTGPIL